MYQYRNYLTGSLLSLYLLSEEREGRWLVKCETHQSCIRQKRLFDALSAMPYAEWCQECQKQYQKFNSTDHSSNLIAENSLDLLNIPLKERIDKNMEAEVLTLELKLKLIKMKDAI